MTGRTVTNAPTLTGMRRPMLLLVPVVVLALAGCGGSKVTMRGEVVLTDAGTTGSGDTCSGGGGFSDITNGTPVTVEDASGKLIGTGSLSGGLIVEGGCGWAFTVTGLPHSAFYKVGMPNRGTVDYSLAQVKAGDITLSLSTP